MESLGYTDTLEGAEMIVLCRSTFQFGQQSLCMEINITTICNREGIWKAVTDDTSTCVGTTGPSGIVMRNNRACSMYLS